MNITQYELMEIVKRHGQWLRDEEGGMRANLRDASLRYADLSGADLRGSDLRGADLSDANLRNSNLRNSNLRGSNLSGSDLRGSDLSGANLRGSNLSGADLSGAVGFNSRIQCLQIPPYKITILDKEIVWGGCTKKTAQEWLNYSGDELNKTDRKYLETITKPFIKLVLANG